MRVGAAGFQLPLVPPLPPDPVRVPRKRLNQRFAVLLLRSTYQAVDDLDFIPMDKFQIGFWKLRQAEYESYVTSYYPLKPAQGELSDPLYFDFISFAQYLAISKEIPDAAMVFTESPGVDKEPVLVRRDPRLMDNEKLPAELYKYVGAAIYKGLAYGFEDAVFGGPKPCAAASWDCAVEGVQALASLFADNGFCLKAAMLDVQPGAGKGGTFKVRYDGTATLWSIASLASRRAIVSNEYTGMVITAFLAASGFANSTYTVKWTDTYLEESWVVA